MNTEVDYKILKNEMILKHILTFNWKMYLLRTFLFLLILDIIIFTLFYRNFSTNELMLRFGISLLIIVFVCSILTPFMINWYKTREKKVKNELKQLREAKE